jgi:hypothetical protein
MFALASFRIMDDHLRFNACQIPTSYLRNSQVPRDSVEQCILPPVQYACRFWHQHLEREFPHDDELLPGEVGKFLHSKFLFWLEALSLLNTFNTAAEALSSLIQQIHVRAYSFLSLIGH